MSGFGKANYSASSGTNFFSIKGGDHGATGHNFYRLMPPYGKQLASGRIYVRKAQHFGYYGVGNGDSGKPVPRPFECIQEMDFKTKMIRCECAECTNRDNMIAKKEQLEAKLKTEGKSKEEIASETKNFTEWLKAHNIDVKYYAGAMNQKREFGVLKIPYKAKEKLDQLINELLEKEGVDATDVEQGVWFDFKRSGEGFNTVYDVEVYRESKQVEGMGRVQVLKLEPLSVEEQDKALAVLPELTETIRSLTAEQISAVVKSGGDPATVDAIMGIGQKQEKLGLAATTPAPAPVAARATPAQAPASATPAPITAGDDEEAALLAQLEASRARKAAAKAAAAAPAPAAPTATLSPALAADDFMADFGFNPNAGAAK